MRSFWTDPANFLFSSRIHPALTSYTDEVCATVARLFAYVGTLALITILGIHAWDQLRFSGIEEPEAKHGWAAAGHSYPAFAVSSFDTSNKSATYIILRHPEGGRKDILRWTGPGEKPVAELEIYRPGREFDPTKPIDAELARRMALRNDARLEAAGVIDSKFGDVALLHEAGGKAGAASCLGFIKGFDDPALRISGFSCQGDDLPARRAAIGCMLNRLILLASGNEPKLIELFAKAELQRRGCSAITTSTDWVTGAENPQLRGTL